MLNALLSNKHTQPLIACLVALYFFYAVVWLGPACELKGRLLDPIRPLICYWRLDRSWALFSPTIRNVNYHTCVTITFEDGTKVIWQLPRMDRLNMSDRLRWDKWRKLDVDSLPWDKYYKGLWPDFARYIGRKFYNPSDKPVSLELNLFFTDVAPPPKQPIESFPWHNKHSTVFIYRYAPEDFQ